MLNIYYYIFFHLLNIGVALLSKNSYRQFYVQT